MGKAKSLNISDYWAPLLAAVPELLPVRAAFEESYATADGACPEYLFASEVASFAVAKLAEKKSWAVTELLRNIELLFENGNEEVRTLAMVGFLEDMQNASLHETTKPEEFRPLMSKQMQRRWERLNDSWTGGAPLGTDDFL